MSATWTPENGQCFFCPDAEEGYARKDSHGEFQPACFCCAAKPYPQPVQFVNKKETNEASEPLFGDSAS